MRPMVSLGRMRERAMGLLIRLEVGLGVVIDGETGGVMGRKLLSTHGMIPVFSRAVRAL